jgi:hypothetical protein
MKTSGQLGRKWAGLAGFLWFVLVVGIYYVSHKPFTPAIAIRMAEIFWNTGAALAVWCLAGGLGYKVLGKLNIPALEGFSIQSALGLGLLGTAWLVIGASLGFGWIQGLVLASGLALLLFKDIRCWLQQLGDLKLLWNRSGRLGKFLGGEILLILLATMTIAMAPPVKFDALVYHLKLPELYLDHGSFFYVPEIMFWGMPQIGEMLFTWAISIGGYPAAAILGWLSGLAAMVGLFGLIQDNLGLQAAWGGLASLLAGFTLASSLSWGYVDWLAILFGTAFLIGMQLWVCQKTPGALWISGTFAGMALATKYTAGILLIAGTVLIIWNVTRRGLLTEAVRPVFQFLATALVIFSPWLIKNFLATGSPIYPFIFTAGAMDQIRLDSYQGGLPWGSWLDTVFLPWRATSLGIEATSGYSASIGPLLLGLSIWAWLGYRYYSSQAQIFLKNAALILTPGILLWMIVGRFSGYLLQSRLYLAIFPAIAVLAGGGYQSFSQLRISGVRLGRITGGLIVFVLGLTAFEVGVDALNQGSLAYAAGLSDPKAYQQQNLGMYSLALAKIEALPPGSRVLFLWEPRSLGCALDCDPDEILDRWLHDLSLYGDAEAVLAAWHELGFSHLLYYQLGADFLRQEDDRYQNMDWETLARLKSRLTKISDLNDIYQLYELP